MTDRYPVLVFGDSSLLDGAIQSGYLPVNCRFCTTVFNSSWISQDTEKPYRVAILYLWGNEPNIDIQQIVSGLEVLFLSWVPDEESWNAQLTRVSGIETIYNYMPITTLPLLGKIQCCMRRMDYGDVVQSRYKEFVEFPEREIAVVKELKRVSRTILRKQGVPDELLERATVSQLVEGIHLGISGMVKLRSTLGELSEEESRDELESLTNLVIDILKGEEVKILEIDEDGDPIDPAEVN